MSKLKGALIAALLFAATGVIGVPTATADEPKDKTKVKKPEPPAAAEPGKTIIIQLDASKIPPELLKDLLKLSQANQPTKPVTKPEFVKPEPTKPVIKPEPTKPGAKPDTTKPVIKPEPTKPGTKLVKTITLSAAIEVAEKLTKGTAVKAEREDEDGKVVFEIEVLDGKGGKTEVVVDGNGNVMKSAKQSDDKDEKGKKKKDD